ncbi:MAG: hypothetical protein ACP5PV_12000 [Methanothrix sp.]
MVRISLEMSDALYSRLKKETQDMLDLIVIVEDRGAALFISGGMNELRLKVSLIFLAKMNEEGLGLRPHLRKPGERSPTLEHVPKGG